MTASLLWAGTITALSSLSHGGDTRGTITLLRRELVAQPDGSLQHVPIISGNAIRGVLRRLSEQMLRDTLGYEHRLPLAAAHALRGGGALAKTSAEPLSGQRLARLRALVPHVAIFGAAAGGRLIDGCLQVGKAVPFVAETSHITGVASELPVFDATQVETYVRRDDTGHHGTTTLLCPPADGANDPDSTAEEPSSRHLVYRVETFPAGTPLAWWARLDRATDLEIAYFADLLASFATHGHLGGRTAIGHGRVRVDVARELVAGTPPTPVDWRAHLTTNRDDTLTALEWLT